MKIGKIKASKKEGELPEEKLKDEEEQQEEDDEQEGEAEEEDDDDEEEEEDDDELTPPFLQVAANLGEYPQRAWIRGAEAIRV